MSHVQHTHAYRDWEGFTTPPCPHQDTRAHWTRETGSFTVCSSCELVIDAPDLDPRRAVYDWAEDEWEDDNDDRWHRWL